MTTKTDRLHVSAKANACADALTQAHAYVDAWRSIVADGGTAPDKLTLARGRIRDAWQYLDALIAELAAPTRGAEKG